MLVQTILDYMFRQFGQKRQIGNWSVILEIFLVKSWFLDQGSDSGLFETGWEITDRHRHRQVDDIRF